MKLLLAATFILVSLTVSCVPSDTVSPQIALIEATAPTLTPEPTLTPLPTLTPTKSPTITATPSRQLPRLYIDGPYVKRSDTRLPVWLKGVNVEEFRQRNPHTFTDLFYVQGLGIILGQKWGINLLRIAIDPETVAATLTDVDLLINFASENGMYVILAPFASAVNPARDEEHLPVPDDLVAAAMGYLAGKFKDKTNVLYGIWNEPHPDSIPSINYDQQWQVWMNAAIKTAQSIRDKNPNAILVVPGGNKWARDLTYYQAHPFPFDKVIYDVHDYYAYPGYQYRRDMWTWAIGRYPLLIGEFGGDPTNPSDPKSISYMKETLAIVNQNPGLVHYAMYALTNDGVWGIFTHNWARMPKGNVLFEELGRYPPTRFY